MGISTSQDQTGSVTLHHEASRTSSPRGDRPSAVPGALYVQGLVAEFHQVYGCATDVPLGSAPDALIDLRIDLIQEELAEVIAAMRAADMLAVARELADLAYVTASTAVAFGLTLSELRPLLGSLVADSGQAIVAIGLRSCGLIGHLSRLMATIARYAQVRGVDLGIAVAEVHRANLSKLGPDGRPVMRADGKILKGAGFTPPDMRSAVVAGRKR